MTAKMGRYRYWGDQKPDTSRPLLTVTRPLEAVGATAPSTGEPVAVEGTGTLRVYGPIDSWGGYWGVSAKEVAIALDLLAGAERIVVRVNSPGGESSEGRAIMNLLRACQADTLAVVDGAAYSAASYIAVGCDETVMSPGTTLMIHDTSTFVYGNADELRKQAGVLDTISDSGAELYADVAGGTVEEWRARQKAETWYTAAGAVEAGLADRVGVVPDSGHAETAGDTPEPVEDDSVEDRARATYDLSLFDKAPADALGAPGDPSNPKPPNASAVGSTKTEGGSAVAFSTEQMTNLREKLGLAETADEAAIVAAVNAVVEESLEERPEAPRESTPPTPPTGMSIVETAVLDGLRAGAAAGIEAQATLRAQTREAVIDKALRAGKITAGRREHWVKSYDADPEGTTATLESLAAGLVPVTEIGHADANDTKTAEDALYDAVFGAQKGA